MIEPDICEDCTNNDHEHCRAKKQFANLRGIKCDCYVCKDNNEN